jgi:hypothetical protein
MDIADLTRSLAYGNTIADAASMLCRDEDEVRQKAKELGLEEHPGKRPAFAKVYAYATRRVYARRYSRY